MDGSEQPVVSPPTDWQQPSPGWDHNRLSAHYLQARYKPSGPVENVLPKWRVFRWVFLALQLSFVGWIIDILVNTSSSHAEEACRSSSAVLAQACQDVYRAGRDLDIIVIVAIWVAVDVILGLTYLVWKQKV